MEPWREALSFPVFRSRLPAGAAYGYGGGESGQALRRREFARLGGMTYLDHAGATLFPQSLLKAFTEDLNANIYGNPHSQSISSKLTYDTIEHVRYSLLKKDPGPNEWRPSSFSPPPPLMKNDEPHYEIDQILDSKLKRGHLLHLIKWLHFGPEENEWVEASHVHAPAKIRAFHKLYPLKPGKEGNVVSRGQNVS